MRPFVNQLLEWGEAHRRKYPWRSSADPYKILIAEMMLQRTKANQVVPVYEKFLKRFPDIESLDSAAVNEILEVIAPLGLEYRAERFRRVAHNIVSLHSGQVPMDVNSLLGLFGIGNCAAHAIICFAYDQDFAIVDTNVARSLDEYSL